MTIYTHEVDGIDVLIDPVTLDPGAPDTLIGATAKCYALNKISGVSYTGSASVASATSVRGTWASMSVPAGVYSVQVIVTQSGFHPATIYDEAWSVAKSAGTA